MDEIHAFEPVDNNRYKENCAYCLKSRKYHPLTIALMQNEAWVTSEDHGFHDDNPTYAGYPEDAPSNKAYLCMKLMLIVSEVSEALEDLRSGNHAAELKSTTLIETDEDDHPGKPYGFMSELADIVIRVGDLASIVGGDLEEAVRIKMAYNKTREHMHGKAV